MRNYFIGIFVFVLIIFIIAIAFGQSDEIDESSFYEMEYHDAQIPHEEVNHQYAIQTLPEEKAETLMDETSDYIQYGTSSFDIPNANIAVSEQIIVRTAYTTSYNKETRNPNWVAWKLTKEHTDGPFSRKGVPYYDERGEVIGVGPVNYKTIKGVYIMDMDCEPPRQLLTDWSTQYNMSHGHMCPAGDNKWSKAAMNQSFLLSNMCPQDQSLNSGAWNKLEEKCRTWAIRYDSIYIVAGPIYYESVKRKLGSIAVPDAFFKVVLRMTDNQKAIGFIYKNDSSSQHMQDAVCSVDYVESISGFDFFSSLPDDIESTIESNSSINEW